MEGKGRGLEGKGTAGGVCSCRLGGVLMRSTGKGAVCIDPRAAAGGGAPVVKAKWGV